MDSPDPTTPPAPLEAKPASGTTVRETPWEVYWPRDLSASRSAIPIASFPPIVYFWPTMIALAAGAALQALGWLGAVSIGWMVTAALAFNLTVIVLDLDQKKFLIACLLGLLLGALAWIAHDKEWAVLSSGAAWLAGLAPTYSTDALLLLFTAIAALFLVGMMRPRFDYWRFEPNEFTHYVQPFGRDLSIPRQGSTVSREVPDLLEFFLLFGGGSLVIKREGQVVARIDHIPFLGRRMVALEAMLGVTRVQSHDPA
jgi:hypothetical protein